MYYKVKTLSGWGNYPKAESKTALPKNLHVLDRDFTKGKKYIARGLGRSYGDQAINKDEYVIDLHKINKIISFDAETGVLHCQAGTSLKEIIEVFAPRGWFPMICPGTKYVTIGGAIANDIHGKAHHIDGSYVNSVEEMEILLADGRTVTANRKLNEDLFRASFGGLGLLGIILNAKIRLKRIETTFFKQKAVVFSNIDDLLEGFEKYDAAYDYSVAWVDSLATGRKLGKSVLTMGNAAVIEDLSKSQQKNPLLVTGDPKLTLPVFLPNFSLNPVSVKMLNKVIEFSQSKAASVIHYEKFFFPLDAINNWNRGYGKRGFIQYQFVIPLENGVANIRKILNEIAKSGCTPFLNVLKKFGKGHGYLSFPMEGYTFAIDFPMTRSLPSFVNKLDQMVIDFGGRIYLGKDAMLDRDKFQKMYPDYGNWLSIKKKYDPDNVFSSNLSRRIGLDLK